MSKQALIIGAAVIALALFYKPITDMLNGFIGGGGATDQYFNPRDTSTSQGPAYDPPSSYSEPQPQPTIAERLGLTNYQDYGGGYYGGKRTVPGGKELYIEGNINSGIGDKIDADTGQRFFDLGNGLQLYTEGSREINPISKQTTTPTEQAPTDKKGTEQVTTSETGQDRGLPGWIQDNPTDAAFIGLMAYGPTKNAVKWGWNTLKNTKAIPKAYQVAKETAPKVVEKSKALAERAAPKAIEFGTIAIKSPLLRKAAIGLTVGAVIKESIDRYKIFPPDSQKAKDPVEWFQKMGENIYKKVVPNKGGTAPSKYINTAPAISAQRGYSTSKYARSAGNGISTSIGTPAQNTANTVISPSGQTSESVLRSASVGIKRGL